MVINIMNAQAIVEAVEEFSSNPERIQLEGFVNVGFGSEGYNLIEKFDIKTGNLYLQSGTRFKSNFRGDDSRRQYYISEALYAEAEVMVDAESAERLKILEDVNEVLDREETPEPTPQELRQQRRDKVFKYQQDAATCSGQLYGHVKGTDSQVKCGTIKLELDHETAYALCNLLIDNSIDHSQERGALEKDQEVKIRNLGAALGRIVNHPAANNGGRAFYAH